MERSNLMGRVEFVSSLGGLFGVFLASASSPSAISSFGYGRNIIWPWRVIWFSTLINPELTIWLVIKFGSEKFLLSLPSAPDLFTDNFRSLMLAFAIPCDVLRVHIQQIALGILTPSLINLTAVMCHSSGAPGFTCTVYTPPGDQFSKTGFSPSVGADSTTNANTSAANQKLFESDWISRC